MPLSAHLRSLCLGGVRLSMTGLTLARLAEAASSSRMTLHRRDVTIPSVIARLSLKAAAEFQNALFPFLSGTGPADKRVEAALGAMCDVADLHLHVSLLAGLFADDEGIFHAETDEPGALPTGGTRLAQPGTTETATVLFNTAGWGYIQLRHSQRWPSDRARDGVIGLVMGALRRLTAQ